MHGYEAYSSTYDYIAAETHEARTILHYSCFDSTCFCKVAT